jgi:hypothetical protein
MIGIFTHRNAVESDRVLKWLVLNQHNVVRINLGQGESTCTLQVDSDGLRKAVGTCDGRTFSATDFSSTWWHQSPPRTTPTLGDEAVQALADSSRQRLWEAFAGAVSPKAWLSPPSKISAAQNKLIQYLVASASGLEIPNTFGSSDPIDVRTKAPDYPVVKALGDSNELWRFGPNGHGALTTFSDLDHVNDEDIQMASGLYQELIESELEVRIVVVPSVDTGFAIYAGAIRKPPGILDVRLLPPATAAYQPLLVPEHVQLSLVDMLNRMGLRFCSADFVVRPDGEYVFLDLNATGAWWWIDDLYDRAITGAISASIATGSWNLGSNSKARLQPWVPNRDSSERL